MSHKPYGYVAIPAPLPPISAPSVVTMLMVHRPSPSPSAGPLSRHHSIERGRSRDVSPVALARRASEERRSVVLAVNNHLSFARRQHCDNTRAGPSKPSLRLSPAPMPPAAHSRSLHDNRAGPSGVSRRHIGKVEANDMDFSHQCPQSGIPSKSRATARPATQTVSTKTKLNSVDSSLHPCKSLGSAALPNGTPCIQDQMQEAYAADDLHLARILFLKTKGIEVTSDKDPRIAQVRDEDFVFVSGGELLLDEESLAAMKEAERRDKEQRNKDGQVHRWRVNEPRNVIGSDAARHEMTRSRSIRVELDMKLRARESASLSNSPSQQGQLRVRATKFGRLYTNNGITRHTLLSHSVQAFTSAYEAQVSALSLTRNTRPSMTLASPCSISYQDVLECVRGPLFHDDEPLHDSAPMRTRAQMELLESLLEDHGHRDVGRRLTKGKARRRLARTWTESPAKTSFASNAGVTCSLDSTSTISRTNSWASCASEASISTVLTSPPTSPIDKKAQLPPLVDVGEHRMAKSLRTRRSGSIVPLSSTPLMWTQETSMDSSGAVVVKQFSYTPERQRRGDRGVLVSRVKQSVSSLIDFASKVQQSYIRTIHFAVPIPVRHDSQVESEPSSKQLTSVALKPIGFRAKSSDVKVFAPQPRLASAREPLFPSEHNWPLVESNAEPLPPRVFTPIAFVPPSPLRPRYTPLNPEWRLRPVANPVTLRLKALQNVLGVYGVPWEGRAHAGSLGCGRDRLTGVAFEGLGGSRLPFEAKAK